MSSIEEKCDVPETAVVSKSENEQFDKHIVTLKSLPENSLTESTNQGENRPCLGDTPITIPEEPNCIENKTLNNAVPLKPLPTSEAFSDTKPTKEDVIDKCSLSSPESPSLVDHDSGISPGTPTPEGVSKIASSFKDIDPVDGIEVGKIAATENMPQKENTEKTLKELNQEETLKEENPENTLQEDNQENTLKENNTEKMLAEENDVCSDTSKSPEVNASASESVYYVKWIDFGQSKLPIVTQNENGPCPLLAIMNVLFLKGKVKLAPMQEMVTSEQLMTYLGDCILENMPQNLSETTQANYEQNMQDAMGVMYKLQTGLDVNVKFTGVSEFEYTPELIIFDLLEISLYHGWLVDPQDFETLKAVESCSYNQLVERIISLKHSDQPNDVTKALVAEQFLDRAASQLTYHGLCELSSTAKDNELSVFFRNNHFNTMLRHKNELFILVTDQGFLTEGNVVWETLSNVDGNCHFVDALFRTYTKPTPSTELISESSVPVGSAEQIDQDYQVALFLQQEVEPSTSSSWSNVQEQAMHFQSDHDFALHLQEEENRRVKEAAQQQQQQNAVPAQPAPPVLESQAAAAVGGSQSDSQRRRPARAERREKDEKCVIL